MSVATEIRKAFPGFEEDFDQIEAEVGAWEQRLSVIEASVRRGERRAQEMRQNNVELLMGVTAGGLAIRVKHLLDAVVSLINKNNAHSAPAVARALFESCCVPIYLRRELIPRLEKGRVEQVHKLVFRAGLGSMGVFGNDHIKPLKVDSLIRSARSELTAMVEALPEEEKFNAAELIDTYYGPLTELTHPNWGAITIGIRVGIPVRFSRKAGFDDPLMHAVVSSSAYIVNAGGRALDDLLPKLSEFPMDLPNEDPWGVDTG
jgi:hypothetical protein